MTIDPDHVRARHEPEISGLRGMALLIVVGGHLVQRLDRFYLSDQVHGPVLRTLIACVSAPAAGVYLFFAISGYLIAGSLRGMPRHDGAGLAAFYTRRAIRIVPPYALVLGLTGLLLSLSTWQPPRTNLYNVQPESLLESLIASVFYVHKILYNTFPRLFPPGWSLEVEVHFYILAPFLFLLFERLRAGSGLGGAAALMLGVSGAIALLALGSGIERLPHSLLAFLPLFGLGLVVQAVRRGGRPPWPRLAAPRIASPLGWLALAVFVTFQPWVGDARVELVARIVLVAVLFNAVAAGEGTFFRACTHPRLVRIGIMSYSAYLVHLQTIQAVFVVCERSLGWLGRDAMAIVSVGASLVAVYLVASLFYRVVERPLRRYVMARGDVGRILSASPP